MCVVNLVFGLERMGWLLAYECKFGGKTGFVCFMMKTNSCFRISGRQKKGPIYVVHRYHPADVPEMTTCYVMGRFEAEGKEGFYFLECSIVVE